MEDNLNEIFRHIFWTTIKWIEPCHVKTSLCGFMQTAKAQISLRISTIWSGPSLSTNRIIGYYIMYECRAKAWMILSACPGWSESGHFAHVWRLSLFGLTLPKLNNTGPVQILCCRPFFKLSQPLMMSFFPVCVKVIWLTDSSVTWVKIWQSIVWIWIILWTLFAKKSYTLTVCLTHSRKPCVFRASIKFKVSGTGLKRKYFFLFIHGKNVFVMLTADNILIFWFFFFRQKGCLVDSSHEMPKSYFLWKEIKKHEKISSATILICTLITKGIFSNISSKTYLVCVTVFSLSIVTDKHEQMV